METWLKGELQHLYDKAPLFASSDPHETRAQTGQAFKEHELRWTGGKVDAALHRTDLGALSFFILRYGAAVRIEAGRLDGFMLFQVPLSGSAQIRIDGHIVAASSRMGALVSPTLPLQLDWSEGCEQLLVKIPRERVEETCRDLLGGELENGAIEFAPEMPMGGAIGRAWQHHLGGLLANHGFATEPHARPLIRAQEQALIHHLLLRQPSNYSGRLWRPDAPAPQRRLRVAEEFIRANLFDPIALEQIAAASGASLRSLCQAFRTHHDCSPMAYVRQARLDAARGALLTAAPGARVTDIALACGFSHLGRFASSYRARYGETPLQTLKR
ncbi:MAG: transcriptional regulator, AraC family [Massilia sp.]|nr:transcriptional regulator, AraC family [Massilia sp.]